MTTEEKKQHFLNLYYVTLGLFTGIIGSIWVYYFSKWLEKHFPSTDWDVVFYVSTVLFALWLFFWIRYVVHGLRKQPRESEKKEEKKVDTDKEEEQRSKYKDSPLLLEYQMAQEMHNYYGKISWEIASILVAGSFALVGLSLQSQIIGQNKSLFIAVAVSVTILMAVMYFLFRRIAELVEIHVARLNQIEETLHFHQHRLVHEAHTKGFVTIEGEKHPLSSPRARNSVLILAVLNTLSVWLIAILLMIL